MAKRATVKTPDIEHELGKPGVPEDSNVVELIPDLNENGKRRVTVVLDHALSYPELYMSVYIEGPKWEQAMFAEMFTRAGCTKAETPAEADLVVFVGGVDVDPRLYNPKSVHKETNYADEAREIRDIQTFIECVEAGIPMLGICRGAQFGHVMHKGSLYQEVDGHYGDHGMWDLRLKERIERISSVHHQMIISNKKNGMELIATANQARNRWVDQKENHKGVQPDIEAFFYRDTLFLGIQGHPEYSGYPEFTVWALNAINDYIYCSPDADWDGKVRRIKQEIRDKRKFTYNQRALDYLEDRLREQL